MTALQKAQSAFGFEAALFERIKRDNIRYLSFDIFDTLVFRRVSHPHDIFTEIGALLRSRLNLDLDPNEYRELRAYAEQRARSSSDNNEVRLEDILENLPFSDATRKYISDTELEVEKRFSYINQSLADTIQALKQTGIEVILISDMYLNAATIRQTYFEAHPVLRDLPLYVSCDENSSKKKGSLFSKIAQYRKWRSEAWLHVGDNVAADVDAPNRQGIQTLPYYGESEYRQILKIERILYQSAFPDNALRMKSAVDGASSPSPVAFHLGAFVWGPLFLGFADWCIQKCLASECQTLVCLMREAEVFSPLIKLRLKQRDIQSIEVKTLSASRKSTYWAALDTSVEGWYLQVLNHMSGANGSSFRTYTVCDFYKDAGFSIDDFYTTLGKTEIRKLDSAYYKNTCALTWLKAKLEQDHQSLELFINHQKALFRDYFYQETQANLASCCIVDLGNGATISHQLERILEERAQLNLLFYATERIYRFTPPILASGFFAENNCQYRSHKLLQRSQECIEPLLVGTGGSCIAYQRSEGKIEAVLSQGIKENQVHCDEFLLGLKTWFYNTGNHTQPEYYKAEFLEGILARYINLPTESEARLFKTLKHEDNFGSQSCYPVIDDQQIRELEKQGIDHALTEFQNWRKWRQGKIHWPQAVFTLVDKHCIQARSGFLSYDNKHARTELIRKIQLQGWTHFTAYGAGEFFQQSIEVIERCLLKVDCIVDKKAEVNGAYLLHKFEVTDLESALKQGKRRFAIFSFAFQDEIRGQILGTAKQLGIDNIEIISQSEKQSRNT